METDDTVIEDFDDRTDLRRKENLSWGAICYDCSLAPLAHLTPATVPHIKPILIFDQLSLACVNISGENL